RSGRGRVATAPLPMARRQAPPRRAAVAGRALRRAPPVPPLQSRDRPHERHDAELLRDHVRAPARHRGSAAPPRRRRHQLLLRRERPEHSRRSHPRVEGGRPHALRPGLGRAQPRLARRDGLRADHPGQPAPHRDGIAPLAGGPEGPDRRAGRRPRLHDEPLVIALDDRFLRGSYPPIVTPFRDGAVDLDALAGLVERQAAGGSHGVLVCGTTAEPSTLTAAERAACVREAVRAAAGRVPVVAAVGSQSHAETLELLGLAERDRADAVLIVTPYYVRPPQRGLVEYFADLARRTALPVLVYHIPGRAAVEMAVET